jgi:apolipoprotein N-acyltransferase
VVTLVGGRFVPAAEPRHTAHLVQTNIAQATSYPANWMEQMTGPLDEIERLSIEAAKQKPGVIVWPEVPAPFYLQDAKFAERAARMAREGNAPFLLGIVDWKPQADAAGGVKLEPYNSAALLDASGRRVFAYDKIHLVAFGEYVPLRNWLTFAEKMTAEVGDFRAGTTYAIGELAAAAGVTGKFGVVICFEAVFPDLVRKFVLGGAELLVNISNDGWFGRSGAPAQHAAMARVRAIENRRWLLRATNTGETLVVDPYGRETVRLEPGVRGVLTAGYDFRSDRTLYSRFGDWLAWLSTIVAAGMIAAAMRRGSKEVRT